MSLGFNNFVYILLNSPIGLHPTRLSSGLRFSLVAWKQWGFLLNDGGKLHYSVQASTQSESEHRRWGLSVGNIRHCPQLPSLCLPSIAVTPESRYLTTQVTLCLYASGRGSIWQQLFLSITSIEFRFMSLRWSPMFQRSIWIWVLSLWQQSCHDSWKKFLCLQEEEEESWGEWNLSPSCSSITGNTV